MTILKRHILFFLIFFFLFSFHVSANQPAKIRVAIAKDKQELVFSVYGPYDIIDLRTKSVLSSSKKSATFSIYALKDGFRIDDGIYHSDGILIDAKKKVAVTLNKRKYRGDISVLKDEAGKLCVVNTLDLESYIKGVLYHEISHKWPMDAIKAQAVAVRTYAMYQKEIMKNKNYDVTADTSSQVYGGYTAETSKTNRAVNFTRGEVLLYRNKIFPAYFHATCGGITENAAELWNIDIEPLRGSRVCGFCRESPHYFWKSRMELTAVRKKVGALYTLKGDLANISVSSRNPSGRIRSLELRDSNKKSVVISAKDFRAALGPDVLRSTNFSIILENPYVVFAGKGWGHGVGLCQWGAFGMSKKGYSYTEILEFYYPGAKIVRQP